MRNRRKRGKVVCIVAALALCFLVVFNATVYVQARTGHIILTKYPCLFYNIHYGAAMSHTHNVEMVVGSVTYRSANGEIKTAKHVWPVKDGRVEDFTLEEDRVLTYEPYYRFPANAKSLSDFASGLELQKPLWSLTTLFNLPPTFFMTVGSNT